MFDTCWCGQGKEEEEKNEKNERKKNIHLEQQNLYWKFSLMYCLCWVSILMKKIHYRRFLPAKAVDSGHLQGEHLKNEVYVVDIVNSERQTLGYAFMKCMQ